MKEINEIVYTVADVLGKRNNMPFILSAREKLMEVRATFLRRDFDKNHRYRESSLQNLGNLKLKLVAENEFTLLQKVCKLKRTEDRIPLPVETKHINHFAFVGAVDGNPAFQYSSEYEIENIQHELFPRPYPSFFYKDGYIYVADFEGNHIHVKAMFHDVREADKFKGNDHANCSIAERAYIPTDMVTDIQEEMKRFYATNIPEETKVNNDQIEL